MSWYKMSQKAAEKMFGKDPEKLFKWLPPFSNAGR